MYAGLSTFARCPPGSLSLSPSQERREIGNVGEGVKETGEERSKLDPGSGEDGEEMSDAEGYETLEEEEESPSQQSLAAGQQEVGEEEMSSKQSVAAGQQQNPVVKGEGRRGQRRAFLVVGWRAWGG